MLRRVMMASASGVDPYWSNVVSLLHFDGADGSATFTDQKGKIWTHSGTAQLDTDQAKFGASSLLLSGSGGSSLISASASADFDPAGDYTAEGWIRPSSVSNNAVLTMGTGNNSRITLGISNTIGAYLYTAVTGSAGVRISGGTVPANTWSHIAATKASGMWRLFLSGALIGTSSTNDYPSGSGSAFIGAGAIGDTLFAGHIDEIRITKGVARYTSAFTPPSAPFPNS